MGGAAAFTGSLVSAKYASEGHDFAYVPLGAGAATGIGLLIFAHYFYAHGENFDQEHWR